MRQKQMIASLGALAATGLAVYLVKRKKSQSTSNEINNTQAAPASDMKNRSRVFNKAKSFMYEPDDHPE